MTHWKRQTVTRKVLDNATLGRDVAAIARETGAKPDTVRAVLRRAMVHGEIHLERFRRGMSYRAIKIAENVECVTVDVKSLNKLMIGWSKNNNG